MTTWTPAAQNSHDVEGNRRSGPKEPDTMDNEDLGGDLGERIGDGDGRADATRRRLKGPVRGGRFPTASGDVIGGDHAIAKRGQRASGPWTCRPSTAARASSGVAEP
jgi:hypothetical protein